MSRNKKTVYVKKGDVTAEATEVTLAGLLKHGWTVVDDGDKDVKKAAEAERKEAEKIEQQVDKIFGSDNKE